MMKSSKTKTLSAFYFSDASFLWILDSLKCDNEIGLKRKLAYGDMKLWILRSIFGLRIHLNVLPTTLKLASTTSERNFNRISIGLLAHYDANSNKYKEVIDSVGMC